MSFPEHRTGAPPPLVSVVMPARNRAASIARAIDSVLAQTYRNFELIVIDDGSTDSTREIAASYGSRLKLIHNPGRGVYAARNAAVAEAKGELIAFADSDDAWLPDRLAAQIPLLARPEVGLVFADTIHVAEAVKGAKPTGITSFRASPPRRGRVADALAWRNFVPTTTVLVRRSCLEEIGGFPTSARLSADYLAWFRIALRHELDFVDSPLCIYTFNPNSISFDLGRAVAARIALFSEALASESDPRARALIRRLLFNLSLHLGLAALRGRAPTTRRPFGLAARTARAAAGFKGLPWGAAFIGHQLWLRTYRMLH
jgi:glycosyltransferase involved in cell wall biosynthesis